MGCFLGCFGGEKDHKRRKHSSSTSRISLRVQSNRIQHLNHKFLSTAEQTVAEAPPYNLAAELRNTPEEEDTLNDSPRKRVTFNPNITTYEHVLVKENIDSMLLLCKEDIGRDDQEELKSTSPLCSPSVITSVASYPPNHRYHNARDSYDEAEVYGDSDLFVFDDDEEDYDKCDEQADNESVLTASKETKTENSAEKTLNEEVEVLGLQAYARERSDSVLNPIGNVTQWKDEMLKAKPQEKLTVNFQASRASFSSEPRSRQEEPLILTTKSEPLKNEKQEIGVEASLSNWLVTPERNFEDRPILGALTVDELRQISATSVKSSPRSPSPDEMPIIGSVGSYWNHSASETPSDSASSHRGLPNTIEKYREDMKVNWHSTPFETRLDRALELGAAEA